MYDPGNEVENTEDYEVSGVGDVDWDEVETVEEVCAVNGF